MSYFVDRSRLYLVLVYFFLSFIYLKLVLDSNPAPVLLLACIMALVVVIVASHDALLRVINQATGQLSTSSELQYFSAFMDLNRKIHNFLEVDDVLQLVGETLRERIQVRRVTLLLSREIPSHLVPVDYPEADGLQLRSWPESRTHAFHDLAFEQEVARRGRVLSSREAPVAIQRAFAETDTSLLVPVLQNDQLLCVIMIGRSDRRKRYSGFEYQMFGYLASQLSLILDRIRVYARVLRQTAMDYAEKMQVMQSLSANIAHEMRTPLSGIRASISGLEDYLPQLLQSYEYCLRQAPDQFPPIRYDQLNTLLGTPRRIQLMIDQANTVIDMLLMNLRENSLDRRQLNPCSAADIVEQAVDRYPFKSGERERLTLELVQDFRFLGIESLCIYILFNLLKNAYYSLQSAQKGDITITLRKDTKEGRLIFRDTGLGIAPDILEHVFDGFFTTREGGTGAGLSFCKRTVLSFDGHIECHSTQGEYAEFVITLPLLGGAKVEGPKVHGQD